MPETIIKVGDKKPPEAGKKRWKVIAPDGVVFQLNSDLAPLFTAGKSYKIFFENHEFQGFKFRVITAAPEEVPDISTGQPATGAYARPPAAKEDEEQINKRHRLNWIGERLDKLVPSGTLITYESLRPIVGILEELYDTISEGDKESNQKHFPEETIRQQAQAYRARANTYKPGQPASTEEDLDDDIPF